MYKCPLCHKKRSQDGMTCDTCLERIAEENEQYLSKPLETLPVEALVAVLDAIRSSQP